MADDHRTTLALPKALHERVKEIAKQERRSVQGQIAVLIEEALQAREVAAA